MSDVEKIFFEKICNQQTEIINNLKNSHKTLQESMDIRGERIVKLEESNKKLRKQLKDKETKYKLEREALLRKINSLKSQL